MVVLFLCQSPLQLSPIGRILFIGNSITQTKPDSAMGWSGNWGAAASQADRDYAHRLQLVIAARQGVIPEIKIIQTGGDLYPAGTLETVQEWRPDLIIFQIGDNAPPVPGAWLEQYAALRAAAPQTKMIAIGVWANNDPRDEYIKQAARNAGMIYVRISDLHTEDTEAWAQCTAEFCHAGLYWHPGDRGMALIAGRILTAICTDAEPVEAYLPLVYGGEGGTVPPK